MIKSISAFAVLSIFVGLCGCQAKEPLPPKALAGLSQMSGSLAAATSELTQTTESLKALTKNDVNVQTGAAAYQAQLDQLTDVLNRSRAKAQASAADPNAFFSQWKAEIDEMSNPKLQAAGRERYADAREQLAPVQTKLEALRDAFRPHYENLQDIATTLKNDPTTAGLKSTMPTIKRTLEENKTVMARASELQTSINALVK